MEKDKLNEIQCLKLKLCLIVKQLEHPEVGAEEFINILHIDCGIDLDFRRSFLCRKLITKIPFKKLRSICIKANKKPENNSK